jgi:hypothetical protein
MDVMVSSSWRSPVSHLQVDTPPPIDAGQSTAAEPFVFRHGRYEVRLSSDRGCFVVEYSSSGRLFGPREIIYTERHIEPRHAAWDVMCRVIRATDCEETGISVGRRAMAWLQEAR